MTDTERFAQFEKEFLAHFPPSRPYVEPGPGEFVHSHASLSGNGFSLSEAIANFWACSSTKKTLARVSEDRPDEVWFRVPLCWERQQDFALGRETYFVKCRFAFPGKVSDFTPTAIYEVR